MVTARHVLTAAILLLQHLPCRCMLRSSFDLAQCTRGPAVQLPTFAIFASLPLELTNTVGVSNVYLSGPSSMLVC